MIGAFTDNQQKPQQLCTTEYCCLQLSCMLRLQGIISEACNNLALKQKCGIVKYWTDHEEIVVTVLVLIIEGRNIHCYYIIIMKDQFS